MMPSLFGAPYGDDDPSLDLDPSPGFDPYAGSATPFGVDPYSGGDPYASSATPFGVDPSFLIDPSSIDPSFLIDPSSIDPSFLIDPSSGGDPSGGYGSYAELAPSFAMDPTLGMGAAGDGTSPGDALPAIPDYLKDWMDFTAPRDAPQPDTGWSPDSGDEGHATKPDGAEPAKAPWTGDNITKPGDISQKDWDAMKKSVAGITPRLLNAYEYANPDVMATDPGQLTPDQRADFYNWYKENATPHNGGTTIDDLKDDDLASTIFDIGFQYSSKVRSDLLVDGVNEVISGLPEDQRKALGLKPIESGETSKKFGEAAAAAFDAISKLDGIGQANDVREAITAARKRYHEDHGSYAGKNQTRTEAYGYAERDHDGNNGDGEGW